MFIILIVVRVSLVYSHFRYLQSIYVNYNSTKLLENVSKAWEF